MCVWVVKMSEHLCHKRLSELDLAEIRRARLRASAFRYNEPRSGRVHSHQTGVRAQQSMADRPPPSNDPLFPALASTVRAGTCVAIIGAGLSRPDYPSWATLIEMLLGRCEVRPEDVVGFDPLDSAEAAKRHAPKKYFAALDDIFAAVANASCSARYHLLARIKFKTRLTLNLDPMLWQTLDCHQNICVSDFPALQIDNVPKCHVFHLHGRLGLGRPAESTDHVLTRTEFEDAYSFHKNLLASFLQQVFIGNDVCFIGCDPAQDNMRDMLRICKSQCDRLNGTTNLSRPTWYYLHDDETEPPASLCGCGISPVRYHKQDRAYSGLDRVLEYLAGRVEMRVLRSGVERSPFEVQPEPQR